MDSIDLKILDVLQRDATVSVADLAEQIGLTTTPCWRRLQKLEADQVIKQRVAILSRDALNLGVDVFVAIKTSEHDATWLKEFANAVTEFDEVMEIYRMSGEIDYLLRVVVSDIADYDRFYQRLIKKVKLSDVSSSFAMEQLKHSTALPLSQVNVAR